MFYEFWYNFCFHVGTPLASNSMFFGDPFLDEFLNRSFIYFWSTMGPKVRGRYAPHLFLFASFFRTLVSFTNVRPTSARNHFSNFFKKLKEYIHTCTFYQSKTYKCDVTVFTIYKKKAYCKKPKTSNAPRHDFGATVASVGTLLVPFWFHLGCVGPILARFWIVDGPSLLVPKSLKELFGTLSAKHLEKIPGTLTFAPHRRQIRLIDIYIYIYIHI